MGNSAQSTPAPAVAGNVAQGTPAAPAGGVTVAGGVPGLYYPGPVLALPYTARVHTTLLHTAAALHVTDLLVYVAVVTPWAQDLS